jgi:GDP-L-fucose synthase
MGADGWLKSPFSLLNKKIFVFGHTGLVGSALLRRLHSESCTIITISRRDLDLMDQSGVYNFCCTQKPDIVIMAAARVGGIADNINHPADFIHSNLVIQSNIMEGSYRANVQKLLFLGSSCIYPKNASNPISENALFNGPLETSNAPYAMAKLAGIVMAQSYRKEFGCDYISSMPCNLYGSHDHFDPERSHVIPALIMKMARAKIDESDNVEIWGSGKPRREFMHVDDLADALVFMLKNYSHEMPLNIGTGQDITIAELAKMLQEISGFQGSITFNTNKPDGILQKLMDTSRIQQAGWKPEISLYNGLRQTYDWYCQQKEISG